MAEMAYCTADGCNLNAICKGYCGAHYARFRRHGDPMAHVPIGATARVKRYGRPAPKCRVDGCQRPVLRRGECSAHYQRRNKRGGYGGPDLERGRGMPARDRILRFTRILDGGCVEWTAGRNAKGYGWVRYEGRATAAHRAVYQILVGPIPEGLTLDHLCLNTWCVAPGHLEPVTASENSLRAWRVRRGEAV